MVRKNALRKYFKTLNIFIKIINKWGSKVLWNCRFKRWIYFLVSCLECLGPGPQGLRTVGGWLPLELLRVSAAAVAVAAPQLEGVSPSHPRPVQCTVFVMCLLYALSTCQILSVSVLKHFCLYSTYCPLHIHPTASTVLYTFTHLPPLSFTHSPFCLHCPLHIHPSA